jgi:hypothetical protein
MDKEHYQYSKIQEEGIECMYSFFSIGQQGSIEKIVAFQDMGLLTYNVALADYDRATNTFSDISNSNNFDLLRLFATIFKIANEFLIKNPFCSLYIQGNTPAKMKLYHRIIKNNLIDLENKCIVLGVYEGKPMPFDGSQEYDYFLIRTKTI